MIKDEEYTWLMQEQQQIERCAAVVVHKSKQQADYPRITQVMIIGDFSITTRCSVN